MRNDASEAWNAYCASETSRVRAEVSRMGYVLDTEQRHVLGERYLLQRHDVGGSGKKLVLTGTATSGERVVIKASSEAAGKKEIERERLARATITKLDFSYHLFTPPKERACWKSGDLLISITEYIAQEKTFTERPTEEQFALGLTALKIQEGVHATTYAHTRTISSVFGSLHAKGYLTRAAQYASTLGTLGEHAYRALEYGERTIEQYTNFLTHADFVPHNLRIRDGEIYLLDYASIHFGNKHESWARFINFMLLYNPELEQAFTRYVRDNRAEEEGASLQLMRIYKALFLVHFYTSNLPATTGALHSLTEARVELWSRVVESLVTKAPLPAHAVEGYKKLRDSLRSPEEQVRQKNLH